MARAPARGRLAAMSHVLVASAGAHRHTEHVAQRIAAVLSEQHGITVRRRDLAAPPEPEDPPAYRVLVAGGALDPGATPAWVATFSGPRDSDTDWEAVDAFAADVAELAAATALVTAR
jgi:menaquinone-dependent protoporphyrinogen IX oxidase